MKKIMIAAAIVCAAAFANAAQCQWNVTGIAQDNTGTVYTGYKLYLCDAAVVSITDLSNNLAIGDFSDLSKEGFVLQTSGTIQQGTTAYAKIETTLSFGDYPVGTQVTYYTLVMNGEAGSATEFMTSAAKGLTAPSAGKMQANFTGISDAAGSSGWQAIPEPTSGLLLLLGVAGLALRRRRA